MIAFDSAAAFNFVNPNDSTTYVCPSTANSYLLVVTSFGVSQVSYNGTNMSKILTFTDPISDGNGNNMYIWGLASPTSGSHTLQLTNAGSGTIGIVCYTGVYQQVQPEAYSTNYSNNGTNNTKVTFLTSAVTTGTDNAWTILFARGGGNGTNDFTASGFTLRAAGNFIFGDGAVGIYDSNGPISPVGSSSLTSTWASGSGYVSNVIISLSPFSDFVPQMIVI